MDIKSNRDKAIKNTINEIRDIMSGGVSVAQLEAGKLALMELCAKSNLFPRTDFPVPTGGLSERTFLVYEDSNGEYALYVNSGGPGQSAGPHDHGGSWAIIAAIEGEETHRLYVEGGKSVDPNMAIILQVTEIVVKPGTSVSMMPDGIHSINAGDKPLLHLHLYGMNYPSQMERKAYDIDTGAVRRFVLDDVGFIEDVR